MGKSRHCYQQDRKPFMRCHILSIELLTLDKNQWHLFDNNSLEMFVGLWRYLKRLLPSSHTLQTPRVSLLSLQLKYFCIDNFLIHFYITIQSSRLLIPLKLSKTQNWMPQTWNLFNSFRLKDKKSNILSRQTYRVCHGLRLERRDD